MPKNRIYSTIGWVLVAFYVSAELLLGPYEVDAPYKVVIAVLSVVVFLIALMNRDWKMALVAIAMPFLQVILIFAAFAMQGILLIPKTFFNWLALLTVGELIWPPLTM